MEQVFVENTFSEFAEDMTGTVVDWNSDDT